MRNFLKFLLIVSTLALTACGGGSNESAPAITPANQTQVTAPTVTSFKLDADECKTNMDCNLTGNISKAISGVTLTFPESIKLTIQNGVNFVELTSGTSYSINTDVIKLVATSKTATDATVVISQLKVSDTTFTTDSSVVISFTETPVVADGNVFIPELRFDARGGTIVSTDNDCPAVVKGTMPTKVCVDSLSLKIMEKNLETEELSLFSLTENLSITDGIAPDVVLPKGFFTLEYIATLQSAEKQFTVTSSDTIRNYSDKNGGQSITPNLQWTHLTPELIAHIEDYENNYSEGEEKDFTYLDTRFNNVVNIFNVETVETISSSKAANMQYLLIAPRNDLTYDTITITPKLSGSFNIVIGEGNNVLYTHNTGRIEANESREITLNQLLPIGNTPMTVTISDIDMSTGAILFEYNLTSVSTDSSNYYGGTTATRDRFVLIK